MKTMTMKTQIPAELSSLQNDVSLAPTDFKTGGIPLILFTSAIMPILLLYIPQAAHGKSFHAPFISDYFMPTSLTRREVFQGELYFSFSS